MLASGVWLAVSQLAPFLGTAGLSVLAGRVLGADLLGQQSLVAFVQALVAALLVGSLTDASVQVLAASGAAGTPEGAGDRRWVVRAHLAAGTAAAVLLMGFGLLWGQLPLVWLVVAALLVVDGLGWGYAATLIAAQGWGAVARRRLVSQLLSVLLAVAALLLGLGVAGIFGAALVASAGLAVSLRAAAPGRSRRRARGRRPVALPRLWGLFAAGEVLTQVVARRIEFLFLAAYSTPSEIAAYSVAAMVVSTAAVLPAALAGAAVPLIAVASASGDDHRVRESLGQALRVTAVASLPLAALVGGVGPSLVIGLYGAEFSRAATLVPLAALALVAVPAGQMCTTYWSALGSIRISTEAGLLGGAADLALAFALVPHHGAEGAVVAGLAGQSLDAVYVLVRTWLALGRFAPGARGWSTSAAAAVVAACVGRSSTALAPGLAGPALGGLLGAVAFGAVVALLARLGAPALSGDDAHWLAGTLPARLGRVVTRPLTRASSSAG